MTASRSYDDPCGIARALDLLDGRWSVLVVRELLLSPKRFTDLVAALPTVSQNVLSQRLRELEDGGVLARYRYGPGSRAWAYRLTARGRELEPVLLALARWGARLPLPASGRLSLDAFVLALRVAFDPDRAGDLAARLDLALTDRPTGQKPAGQKPAGENLYRLVICDGAVRARRTPSGFDPELDDAAADAVIGADVNTLREVVFGARSMAAAQRSGLLRVDGDAELARRALGCFPRPAAGPG
jgi:DNA-binding HxlR family transcriptional regulator